MSAIVVLSARLGPVLPAAALPALRCATVVYHDLPAALAVAFGEHGAVAVPAGGVPAAGAAVLLTLDTAGPAARSMPGAEVITTVEPPGAGLLEAAAVMDRLRSPGGCPWDADQTHSSLGQYLLEETYELLDAIEDGDLAALREELGDVLLQVLFHSRIAAEHPEQAFDVDAVAAELVAKLVSRHPHVFAGAQRLATAAEQEAHWEQLKREEKRRDSSVDGVPLGQPALALAAKLVSRTRRAGLPADLLGLNGTGHTGEALFAAAAAARLAGTDPEAELRAAAKRFALRVRRAEQAARAAGLDPAALDADAWRSFF